MLILSSDDVRRALDPHALIAALAEGFKALSDGQLDVPPRTQVATTQGILMSMAAAMPGQRTAVKLVSVFHGNDARGLPSHQAVVTLVDAETGTPLALMEGAHLTAMRTAAAAIVSIQHLARPERARVAIVGGGVIGAAHAAMLEVLPGIRRVVTTTRATVQAEVAEADVVCLCTSSGEPVVEASWIKPGTHITSVGYRPPGSEVPPGLLATAKLFVESRVAFEAPPVGCAELAGLDASRGTELGEVLLGRRAGRTRDDEITLYKSMGHAMEDLVAANLAYASALAEGLGTRCEL